MGQAKQKRKLLQERLTLSRPMSQARFNIYAIGTRLSGTRYLSEEISYWSDQEERVLGLVFRDTTDDDYGWILLARDRLGRFRSVDLAVSLRSPEYATIGLRQRIAIAVEDGDFAALGHQDDETNYATNLLEVPPGTDSEKLHPHFRVLFEEPSRAPARAVFKEIGPWLTPSDPHFVSEFQFNQFDQRLWEVYLWSALREMGFDITQPEAPDFLCRAPGLEFTVEATTVTASTSGALADHPDPKTPDEMRAFLADYMPMKFGSSLTSKLNKKNAAGESYWERGTTAGAPFILAIADFHKSGGPNDREGGSMPYTQSAIWPYLYGNRMDWDLLDGTLVIRAIPVEKFTYNGKVVPAGFFDLPGAENVSAVLFSNAGTLAKFDRMGIAAGFDAPGYRYFRSGLRLDPDPNAVHGRPFVEEVAPDSYSEGWADELQLFHNPRAKHPLRRSDFMGITQHFVEDGQHVAYSSGEPVLSSRTIILGIKPAKIP
jgi:hypothetical protein